MITTVGVWSASSKSVYDSKSENSKSVYDSKSENSKAVYDSKSDSNSVRTARVVEHQWGC